MSLDSKIAKVATKGVHKSFTIGVVEPYKNILLNMKTDSFDDAVTDAVLLELEQKFEEDKNINR